MNFIEIDCFEMDGVRRKTSSNVKINPAMIVSIELVLDVLKIVTLNGVYYTSYAESYLMKLIDKAAKANLYDLKLN
jgi:hypothetical protein